MLNRLSIKNYRAISSLEMKIGGLTVLTGVNGPGKSSVLQGTWMCCHALSMAVARQIPPQVQGRILAWNDLAEPLLFSGSADSPGVSRTSGPGDLTASGRRRRG